MSRTSTSNSLASEKTAVLLIQRGDGWRTTFTLEPGKSVMVGRSSNCGLQLAGENLAAIHCMLRIHDGELLLQDWFSSSGTLVNGQPAHGEMRVPQGATIQVGDYIIRPQIDCAPLIAAEAPPQDSARQSHGMAAVESSPTPELEAPALSLAEKLQAANEENQMLRRHLQELLDQNSQPNPAAADPFAQETIEMLRAELEQLQSELLHRQNVDVRESNDQRQDDSNAISEGSTLLVERMDELLTELEQSDDRIAALEDLLRVAEEASEAEREERRQLESWVGDIERRMGDRESDWQSEVEGLRTRLADAALKQRHMEQRLAAAASASKDEQARVQIESWQARVAELQQQLAANEQEQEALRQKVRDLQQQVSAGDETTQVEQALREERVRIAQERAELARGRAEVAAMRAQLQQQMNSGELAGRDGDQRMRAFREHLREIHDQEQVEQPGRGLSSRIARLWKRLDG